jgi:hypothetical protein
MHPYLENIKVICIGPKEAQGYLDTSSGNHVDQKLVDRYAYDMERGLWVYPGGIIEVTSKGKLKDGHHRLLAIVQCRIPQVMIVVYNVPNHPKREYDEILHRDTR